MANILSPNSTLNISGAAQSALLSVLSSNSLDTPAQASLISFVTNNSLPSQSVTLLLNILVQNNLDPATASALVSVVTEQNLPIISQSYLINMLSKNQLNTQTQTGLINVMASTNLTTDSQSALLGTLLAPNMDSARQSLVINSLTSSSFTGDNLDMIIAGISNIIFSMKNLARMNSILSNSTNITKTLGDLTLLANTLNSALFTGNSTAILSIMSGNSADLSGCLVNCSNNGDCEYMNGTFSCFCKQNYQGNACQTFYNPCSTYPCLNNGTCVLVPMSSNPDVLDFVCKCNSTLFAGARCQLPIDYCGNRTCNGHGHCMSEDGKAVCQCVQYYYGTDCEQVETTVIVTEKVKTFSTTFTAVSMAAIYSVGIFFDVLRFGFNMV